MQRGVSVHVDDPAGENYLRVTPSMFKAVVVLTAAAVASAINNGVARYGAPSAMLDGVWGASWCPCEGAPPPSLPNVKCSLRPLLRVHRIVAIPSSWLLVGRTPAHTCCASIPRVVRYAHAWALHRCMVTAPVLFPPPFTPCPLPRTPAMGYNTCEFCATRPRPAPLFSQLCTAPSFPVLSVAVPECSAEGGWGEG